MSIFSILLVEDHADFAKALAHILEGKEYLNVAAIATNAEMALEHLSRQKVDLVLVDVSLPDMNGINLIPLLRQKYPALLCAMLSGHLSPEFAQRALDAGAHGYLLKDDVEGILEGIQQILKGEIYVSKEVRALE